MLKQISVHEKMSIDIYDIYGNNVLLSNVQSKIVWWKNCNTD